MKQQKIILITGIVWLCGLSCCQLFIGNTKTVLPPTTSKAIAAQINKTEKFFQQKTNVLEEDNQKLRKEATVINQLMTTTKTENKILQNKLQHTIKQQQLYKQTKDTAGIISNCDSLTIQSAAFSSVAASQDSLQEAAINNLHTQLKNADTIIGTNEERYAGIKQQLTASLATQQQLETVAKKAARRTRRQQFAGNIKNIGIIVLSGILVSKSF